MNVLPLRRTDRAPLTAALAVRRIRGDLRPPPLVGGNEAGGSLEALIAELRAAHYNYMRWRNYSTATIDQRRRTLERFTRIVGTPPILATPEQIAAFRERRTRSGQPLTIAAQAAELAHLAAYYKWAVQEGWIDQDPMTRVPRPKVPRWLPHPIPEAELFRAIDTARPRIRPFYMLAAYAGLRACEIAPLRGEDLWWHTDPPLLVIQRGKGGNPGTVPISPVLEDELRRLPERGWLFPKLDGSGEPLKPHSVSHLANAHLHRIGSKHTLHSLRHRFGTMAYRLSGGDLRATQELMRHESPVSTAVYTQVDQSRQAAVVNALPMLRVVEDSA